MADREFFKSTIMPAVTVRVPMPSGAAIPPPSRQRQRLLAMLPLDGKVFGNDASGDWRATILNIFEHSNSDRVSYDVEFTQTKQGAAGPQPKRNLTLTVSHAGLAHSTYEPNRSESYQWQLLCLVEDWIAEGSSTPELQYFGN